MNKTIATLLANEVTVGAVVEMIMHVAKDFNNSYDRTKENHFADLLVGKADIKTASNLDYAKVEKLFKEETPNIIEFKKVSYDVDNIDMLVTVKAEVCRFGFFTNQEDSKHSWKASSKSDAEHPYRAEYKDTVINGFAFGQDIWAK